MTRDHDIPDWVIASIAADRNLIEELRRLPMERMMTKEHPVLFNAAMVRAILSGRKTQTRRLMKPQPQPGADGVAWWGGSKWSVTPGDPNAWGAQWVHLLPWSVGDHLWVRETWRTGEVLDYHAPRELDADEADIHYIADGAPPYPGRWGKTRSAIHMPRWASRILLEVTNVRVQRLQDISEEDALAEGLAKLSKDGRLWKYGMPDRNGLPGRNDGAWPWAKWSPDYRDAYTRLWDDIYGEDAWAANSWVVATTFKRVEA